MPRRTTLLAVLACAWLWGCLFEPTEVLVQLDTDAPTDRALEITVRVQGGDMHTAGSVRTWIRGDAGAFVRQSGGAHPDGGRGGVDAGVIGFPSSFAVIPGLGAPHDGTVTLTIDALLAPRVATDAPVTFQRVARFRFTPGRTTALPIFLPIRCGALSTECTTVPPDKCTLSVLCRERHLTCGDRGVCVDPNVGTPPVRIMDGSIDVGTCPAGCPGAPHATGRCVAGTCLLSCDEGFGDCDSADANGCETATDTSVTDCGGCGIHCMVPNATSLCSAGRCRIGTCPAGMGDANGVYSDGCECRLDAHPATCAAAAPHMLALGGTLNLTGNLVPSTSMDWFALTFEPGGHPRVHFMTNPGGDRLSVFETCGGAMAGAACMDRSSGATGVTDWEFFDGPDIGMRMTPAPTTVHVRVTSTGATTCANYTLSASN